MQTTFKSNRQTKAPAIKRSSLLSSTIVVKAVTKKVNGKKNIEPISRSRTASDFFDNTGNKTSAAPTLRKPRKFVHVAPKATASEIAKNLGIDAKTRATVRQIIRDLEMKGKLK